MVLRLTTRGQTSNAPNRNNVLASRRRGIWLQNTRVTRHANRYIVFILINISNVYKYKFLNIT